MSHHIYNTEGFVLSSQNVGEANKYFQIFTRDFGMVGATAQGVRFLKSKLRYSLQDYSYSKISLVRGKYSWRITGAIKEKNIGNDPCGGYDKLKTIARIFALLERLVRGEEKNESLFGQIVDACEFLEKENLDGKILNNFEYIFVMRILNCLGYMAESKDLSEFITSSVWTMGLVSKMSAVSLEAVSQINKALKETHL